MDRIIPSSGGSPFGVPPARGLEVPRPLVPTPGAPVPRAKTAADYLKALRRRAALVLVVALLVILPGSVLVLRQADVYRAHAQIQVDPPHFDHRLSTMVPHGYVGQDSPERVARFVPDKMAELHSPRLAEAVASDPALDLTPGAIGQARAELAGLKSRRISDSNTFDLFLESEDPARAAALLNSLLERFRSDAQEDSTANLTKSERLASESQTRLRSELTKLDADIRGIREGSGMFTPTDENIYQLQYIQLNSVLVNKKVRFDELAQQHRLTQLLGEDRFSARPADHPYQQRIDALTAQKGRLQQQLADYRRSIRGYDNDPAVRHYSRQLDSIARELEQLYRLPAAEPKADLSATVLAYSSEEIRQLEREVKALLDRMQDSMPQYQLHQLLVREREAKQQELAEMARKLDTFRLLSNTSPPPVNVLLAAEEPASPIRPNRKVNLALVLVLGLGLGVGLVCLLESLDHRVKAPEHLSVGLTLPLLGVIPQMRHLAALFRGGHIWTAGSPNSPEADAYRNLRASLLGVGGPEDDGAIVTLLVTSAKPGEGKSTTALNLAATCARAGERTLLVDADLRRSSLAEVFDVEHDHLGLVDVLRGELPWQRAVVRTDLPNLDFLPTGDPTEIPIEILGSLELRQLLEALSGHYHRVILDGPAVLGLADCRMLGRAADAALLVVRCGAHALSPPQRAKTMLEQSRVAITGVVFNGLDDDLENWSCSQPGLGTTAESGAGRRRSLARPSAPTAGSLGS